MVWSSSDPDDTDPLPTGGSVSSPQAQVYNFGTASAPVGKKVLIPIDVDNDDWVVVSCEYTKLTQNNIVKPTGIVDVYMRTAGAKVSYEYTKGGSTTTEVALSVSGKKGTWSFGGSVSRTKNESSSSTIAWGTKDKTIRNYRFNMTHRWNKVRVKCYGKEYDKNVNDWFQKSRTQHQTMVTGIQGDSSKLTLSEHTPTAWADNCTENDTKGSTSRVDSTHSSTMANSAMIGSVLGSFNSSSKTDYTKKTTLFAKNLLDSAWFCGTRGAPYSSDPATGQFMTFNGNFVPKPR